MPNNFNNNGINNPYNINNNYLNNRNNNNYKINNNQILNNDWMDDLVNRMQSLQIKTCYFSNQPGHLVKDCAELAKIKQDPNFINHFNYKLNNGRKQTFHNQIATSPVITATTWNNNYDAIIAAAKRSRDEKYASLPKAKRNFKNNNDIK